MKYLLGSLLILFSSQASGQINGGDCLCYEPPPPIYLSLLGSVRTGSSSTSLATEASLQFALTPANMNFFNTGIEYRAYDKSIKAIGEYMYHLIEGPVPVAFMLRMGIGFGSSQAKPSFDLRVGAGYSIPVSQWWEIRPSADYIRSSYDTFGAVRWSNHFNLGFALLRRLS